jgi:hypothetical protein
MNSSDEERLAWLEDCYREMLEHVAASSSELERIRASFEHTEEDRRRAMRIGQLGLDALAIVNKFEARIEALEARITELEQPRIKLAEIPF